MASKKSWFQRLWSQERRRAHRRIALPLAAYYWDGDVPAPRQLRDISPEGMYVLTEQRWYPNTLIHMTLVRSDMPEEAPERSLRLTARVVRSGTDGVGMAFVLQPGARTRNTAESFTYDADRKSLLGFLVRLQADTGIILPDLVSMASQALQSAVSTDSRQIFSAGGKAVAERTISSPARSI